MSDECIICLDGADFVVPLATSYGPDPADKKTLAEILSYLMRPESVSVEDGSLCLNCFNSIKNAYNISILAFNSHIKKNGKIKEVEESIKIVETKAVVESELQPLTDCQNNLKAEPEETIECISSDEEKMTECNEVVTNGSVTLYEIIDDELAISIAENNAIEEVLDNNEVEQDSDIVAEQNDEGEIYEYFVMDVEDTPEVESICEPEKTIPATNESKIKQDAHECETCNKKFTFRDNLRRHMKLHSAKPKFHCSMCPSKSFSTKLLLNNHLYKAHQLPAPHRCNKCNTGFTYLSQLKIHKSTKSCGENKGQFVCEFCSHPFVIASNLKRHLMIHRNDKPFQCGSCSKSFNQKQALIIHERIHNKETPLQCQLCPRRFSDPSSFSKHQKSHLT